MQINTENLELKIADSDAEVAAAQRLRYRVFVEEMGAETSAENHKSGRECDAFDPLFDHLILKDTTCSDMDNVVGVYRLLRGETAQQGNGFYSASEFDLSKLLTSERRVLELGRSCIDPQHRGGIALHMMWNGLAHVTGGQCHDAHASADGRVGLQNPHERNRAVLPGPQAS